MSLSTLSRSSEPPPEWDDETQATDPVSAGRRLNRRKVLMILGGAVAAGVGIPFALSENGRESARTVGTKAVEALTNMRKSTLQKRVEAYGGTVGFTQYGNPYLPAWYTSSVDLGIGPQNAAHITSGKDALSIGDDEIAELAALMLADQQEHEEGLEIGQSEFDEHLIVPGVRSLNLIRQAGVTDAALKHIAQLPYLNTLILTGTDITDEGLKHLAHGACRDLSVLVLSDTNVTVHGLRYLNDLPISDLTLIGTGITLDDIKQNQKKLRWIAQYKLEGPSGEVIYYAPPHPYPAALRPPPVDEDPLSMIDLSE